MRERKTHQLSLPVDLKSGDRVELGPEEINRRRETSCSAVLGTVADFISTGRAVQTRAGPLERPTRAMRWSRVAAVSLVSVVAAIVLDVL